jgi:hypothetical protein
MKRIVFVNQATGYLTIDIINAFAEDFDDLAVIYGDIRVQDVALNPKVNLSRVAEKSRKSNFHRFLKWFVASIQIFFLLLTKYRKYEVFYFSVPPFAYLSSLLLKRRFSVLMWDVYPDVLQSAGISTGNYIYRVWSAANRKIFRRAYRIYTTGEAQASLISKYVSADKINVIPLWSGFRNFSPVTKGSNPFISENRLNGKFIIQYSGNMGLTHNIEILLEVAKNTIKRKDIIFQFIGRGQKWYKVKDEIEQNELVNCMILPFQPDSLVKYSLAAADISVVLVEPGAADMMLPSKVYNLLATGSPLITISPDGSELHKLVDRLRVGKNFCDNDVQGITDFIIAMKESSEHLKEYRNNALSASLEYSPENAVKFCQIYKDTTC